jgi:murein DD-endopeptidase MepM/ murein hydrolase activator NlpD
MANTAPKRKLIQKLKDRYRLIIYNDNTYAEAGNLKLTPFNILVLLGILTIIFAASIYLLVAYTSIRELIPGYPDSELRRTILNNAMRIDSLEKELDKRDKYFINLRKILSGGLPFDYTNSNNDSLKAKSVNYSKSEQDSMLRKQIEEEEQFNLLVKSNEHTNTKEDPIRLHFFAPVNGFITNVFNADKNHFGIDLVAGPNELVKSVLDGTVIMASWTLETGYVIYVQHENNFISVYKHNSELLKREGNRVQAGEAIAIIGNSGEYSTGPHLHFELWENGKPLNPESYILF